MEQACNGRGRTALILYGSESGNAEEIATELAKLIQRQRFETRLTALDCIDPVRGPIFDMEKSSDGGGGSFSCQEELCRYTISVFAISTTGQGELPTNARTFWRKLRSTRLQPDLLDAVHHTSFGLGDSSYPKFNWAHRKLSSRLRQLGAKFICDRGEADEQHPEGVDATFLPWSLTLKTALMDLFPLPQELGLIDDDVFLTPKWAIATKKPDIPPSNEVSPLPASNENAAKANASSRKVVDGSNTVARVFTEAIRQSQGDLGSIKSHEFSKDIRVTLEKNVRVTPPHHWQDVRLFEFSTNPVQYAPGDVLSIHPKNDPRDVDRFIELMGWGSFAGDLIELIPTEPGSRSVAYPAPPINVKSEQPSLCLRDMISNHIDLNAIPRRSFFASISHFTDDAMQKERLIEFTNPELVDELFDYTSRPRRSILEVLEEFDTVKIPLKWVASTLPLIRARQFSIASGGELKLDTQGNGRIELLVAIVRYRTIIRKIRRGLCTNYMADLQPGAVLDVQLNRGGMKLALDRPALLIGPGTGVAPLRSLIYERIQKSESPLSSPPPGQLLFFGGRNRAADYFFEEEWNLVKQKTLLEVFTAFSRDQKSKVYVQDMIRKHSHLVYSILQDGMVYVCGSSGKMPQAVREALIESFERHGNLPRFEAESCLVQMEKAGRYQQETW